MIKITCNDPICGETYFFNDEKFPNAKKVKCPKCGHLQERSSPPEIAGISKKEDDDDWFKPETPAVKASPEFGIDTPPQNNFFENNTPANTDEEDFFSPGKKTPAKPEPARFNQPPPPVSVRAGVDAIGWLVIHDEFTESRTFALRKGINRIGRASDTTPRDVNICIETQDRYMSRHHCDIEVRQKQFGNDYDYILSDRDYGGKKASANGTFLNARKRLTPMDEPTLKDGDTIQVGRTKLVLKLPSVAQNAEHAAQSVRETKFFETIIT